ncbi:cysteine-rich venom protein TEL1-like [Pogonomyrmex barbatus]|uniref:Cysteine-rich venom protein TEL1-like n=1 Tax=Pogonomyrmex barbatus TaxID=144034 RepID=A0A6I9VTY8_9HYME|nr:cysteine-rich venom protein TEL1-like [Pogonomyrmex barbatus]XP_011632515.1 cysteine-rich venom protein TEL1-like [Pogonomyrmex barbatus]XP_011632516.1 cysteine-rich venom protein TEL1-like [Pogonomyrmex barbatus]XP_011632517.1 cysteine-rich venom protein TEL1-like [Pogonomyrmex barbatus]
METMKWLWIIVLVALALPAAVPRKIHRSKPTPRLYGDRVPVNLIRTTNSKVRQKIIDTHNYFRTQVKPSAANMLVMKWHSGLAKAAQRWADRCLGLVHDNATGLYLDGFGQSGQNIFISTGRTLWNFPIRMWYMEYKDFKYGPNTTNEILEIGHYTQVVWATTHLVGCGVSHCTGGKGPLGKDFYMYVCNYAPSGNYKGRLGLPYVAGKPCSMCKDHCTRGSLCTNACYHTDLWSNCAELVRTFDSWVCETDTKEGRERRKFCGATCNCKDKIYYRHEG